MVKRLLAAVCLLAATSLVSAQDFSGFYHIYPKANAKFIIDVNEKSKADGAKIILWNYNGQTNQEFVVVPNGNGYYLIISRHSGKSLDVFQGKADNGTPIVQWKAHGADNQLWKLIPAADGYFYMQNKVSGKVLDAMEFNNPAKQVPGTAIVEWELNNGENQQWKFEAVTK